MAISGMTMLQEMPVMSAYLLKFMPKCYRKVTEQKAKKDWTDCICQMVVEIRAEFSYWGNGGITSFFTTYLLASFEGGN